MAGVALEIFDLLASVAGAVADNWSWLSPIIYGVAAALIAYNTALSIYNGIQLVSNGIKAAAVFMGKVHTARLAMQTGATFAATAAQRGFNAALLACPITGIILAVIALISVFYAAVAAVNKFAGTSISATGIICAAFAVSGAYVINTFVIPLQNGFARLANFFGNVFDDPIAAVKVAFYDMCLTVIGYISNLANSIETMLNKIPGVTVDITSGLDGFYSGLEQARQAVKDESGWVEYVKAWDYIDYTDAAAEGYNFGAGLKDRISDAFGGTKVEASEVSISDYSTAYDTGYDTAAVADGVDSIAGNTGSIADSLDVTEEDLKYLRDIAEQENINRFTTAEIHIDQSGMQNIINKDMDLDGIVSGLTDAVNEAVVIIAEGVHV